MPSYTGPLFPGDPLTMLIMSGTDPSDPAHQDAVAHYLATISGPPSLPPSRGPGGFQPVTAPGTTITPPTRTTGDAGAGQASSPLPTGDPKASPPSSSAISGSDAGSNLGPPPPLAYGGGQPVAGTDTTGASVRDGSFAHIPGEAAALADAAPGGAFGASTPDPTDQSGVNLQKVGSALSDFGKAMAGVAPPAKQDERQGLAPLPGHESRFTPQDLMTLISTLSQAGGKTAPQSLGALIGR